VLLTVASYTHHLQDANRHHIAPQSAQFPGFPARWISPRFHHVKKRRP
jgi:hypothetical protein